MSSNDTTNTSTLKSYLDQATGVAQRAVGSLTGDSSTQVHPIPSLGNPLTTSS